MSLIPRMLLALVSASLINASGAFASVSVRDVEFNRVDDQTSSDDWLECSIEVEVRRDTQDLTRRRPDYVDDLVVELMLGVESNVRG